MNEITILHLSDIHFKKNKDEESKMFRQTVWQRLIDAVITHTKEHGNPDFVVITGDIAFSGKKHEYDDALVFLEKLKSALPKETEFLTVPGNHDVDRSQVSALFSLHQLVHLGKTDQLLESPKDIESFINNKFKSYRDFILELNPSLYAAPGDYFWVKNFKDKNVSFLGLNSAWASEGDDDRFNIALGYPQVTAALDKSKEFSNRVFLMHHPTFEWLKDLERGRGELFKNCRLLLHGHTHSNHELVFKAHDQACLCLGANASYTNDKDGFIGFQFIHVNFSEKDVGVKVWHYILYARREFVPDMNRWPSQDGKPYFEISTSEDISFQVPGSFRVETFIKLPLNKRVFKEIIAGNYLYVDKTKYIYNFFKEKGIYYFLSRPRRFGKSLLVSTLKEIFSGNRELFKDLWIYDKIEWKKYPVIHIDFTSLAYENQETLKKSLYETIDQIANEYGVQLTFSNFKTRFAELIRKLSANDKVVVLIDEYDKPIIDHIETLSRAKGNRNILKAFYEVLKSAEEYLQFVFITGVSKFSRVSIFSGLNNLTDITFLDEYAALLGYTGEEMETYFDHEMARLAKVLNSEKDELVKNVKDWYNGYSWDGKSFVYNPYSILSLFKGNRFENYWFSSATPTFLINFIRESGVDVRDYDGITASSYLFEQYDIENLDIVSLLFQTGYLTAKERNIAPFSKPEYVLTYPNTEVRESFMVYLCHSYTGKNVTEVDREYKKLKESIHRDDLPGFFEIMKSFFASIPYTIVQKDRESYYHLVIYLTMKAIGIVIKCEDHTNRGRIDAVLETPRNIYIFEFKIGAAAKAIRQIEDKKYYEKYLSSSRPVKLVGVGFDTKTRNIRDYHIEELKMGVNY
ncbi:MAG TPA: AAA family ATPase [Candidatus Kapabacteria bacterium]|nr:AAA family ATPase [Candidatus Kapabacteria bacterium]